MEPLQRLIPELRPEYFHPTRSGIHAQAVEPTGALVDDFRIVETERMVHVFNATSPAATSSISLGSTIAEAAVKQLSMQAT